MAKMHLYQALRLQPPRHKRTETGQFMPEQRMGTKSLTYSSSSSTSSSSLDDIFIVKRYQSSWRKIWLSLKLRRQELFRRKQRHSRVPPAIINHDSITNNNTDKNKNCILEASLKKTQQLSTLARSSASLSDNLRLRKDTNKSRTCQQRMLVTDLPFSLFLDIICYLSPRDAISCRLVSSAFHHLLTQCGVNVSLILHHFPRSREGRRLQQIIRQSHRPLLQQADPPWADVFALLARRYHHLGHAIPYRTQKIRPLKDTARLRGVTPWNRFLRLNDKTAPFHYWDPVWSFDENEDLLVYPTKDGSYRVRELSTEKETTVPFSTQGKIMRRIRLCHGILVLEWAEREGYIRVSDGESLHRHFVTAFTVSRQLVKTPLAMDTSGNVANSRDLPSWGIAFMTEWSIYCIGIPLSYHDRFFSAHNQTHYAVYTWQHTRSLWAEVSPLERLIVWEFGKPSPYRPSQQHHIGPRLDPHGLGPRRILSLTDSELDHWVVRQKDTPSLRGLALDNITWDHYLDASCGQVFITEEEHRWAAGPHSSRAAPRLHRVKCTGIPLTGLGPRHVDECGGESDGDPNMAFCWRRNPSETALRARQRQNGRTEDEAIRLRNLWDPYGIWPGRAPCWRHDDFPYLTVSEVYDAEAGVRISARHCFMLETLSVHVRPRLRVECVLLGSTPGSTTATSVSGSDTVSITWSTTASRSATSRNSRNWPNTAEGYGIGDTALRAIDERRSAGTKAEGPDGEEIHFADEMWGELLGQGYICGNERWLIGEDRKGNITILEF